MTKRTITKFIRTHQKGTDENGVVKFFKRLFTLPPLPMKEKPCGICGEPMKYSEGQIVYSHSACRKRMSRHRKGKL